MRFNKLTFTVTLLLFTSIATATIIRVPQDTHSIQAGIYSSIDGDTVLVDTRRYVESINFIGKKIVVGSLFLTTGDTSYIQNTVIDGDQIRSVVTFRSAEDTTSILCGFTLTNGSGTYTTYEGYDIYPGGGIYCRFSHPTLMNLNISNNTAGGGGGVFCENSNPVLKDVIISNNRTKGGDFSFFSWGGGIWCVNSSPILKDVIISDNIADQGGGMYCSNNSEPILNRVSIINNRGWIYEYFVQGGDGGGITCRNSSPSLLNVKISENKAYFTGGGILCMDNSKFYMFNVEITNNSTRDDNGGGILCYSSYMDLDRVEISGNLAGGEGGGIFCHSNLSKIELKNVIINGNKGESGGGIACHSSRINLEDVTISNNIAKENGGGIYCKSAVMNFLNATVIGNMTTGGGGGIYCHSSNPWLIKVRIVENSAMQGGGMFFHDNSMPRFTYNPERRCSIYFNSAISGLGNDLYTSSSDLITVNVDTFTVMNPSDYHAYPISNFRFDILQEKVELVETDLYLSPYGDDTNSGQSVSEPLKTFTTALSKVLTDSLHSRTIYILDGIYSPSSTGERFPIIMRNYISLCGESKEGVILDAEGQSNILMFNQTDSITVENITLTGGSARSGGAIYCYNSSPKLKNLGIYKNSVNGLFKLYQKWSFKSVPLSIE